MVFTYLLLISVIGFALVVFLEHKKSGKTLRQVIRTLVHFNGTRYEQYMRDAHAVSKRVTNRALRTGKNKVHHVHSHMKQHGNSMRSLVRKKLHPETVAQETSLFMKSISDKE
ncbi:hypothetical protein KC866_00590 [Patescibacteria group bacterium]|nr:hypothetical protein [Patescibacteria group bacterium]